MNLAADPLFLKLDAEAICQLSGQIAEPDNYYLGVGTPEGVLPGKILCFARHRAAALMGPQTSPSRHQRCVLLVALKGTGQVCVDAETFALHEGQAQLICPFQFHSYTGVQSEEICWIFVTFEILAAAEIEPLRSRPSRPLGPTEMVLLREILQCWLCEERRDLLPHHLGLLLRRLGATPSESSARARPLTGADLMARVNRYVLPRLDQPLPIKQLAAALGESESHLRAKFRRASGGSLGRHLRQLRLQKACQLLHTTGLNITEVAET